MRDQTIRRLNTACVVGCGLFCLWWLFLAFVANLDAAPGRHALFMDELISFDGVARINAARDFDSMLNAVVGPDQRYGRTFWYTAWAPSNILAPLFGETGQIVGTRLIFSLLLFGSAILLAWTWISSPILRLLAVVSILTTPFAHYYATMPKPEPILLALVALFTATLRQTPDAAAPKFIGLSFILLGLAFGTKISIAPAVAAIGGYAILQRWLLHGDHPLRVIFFSAFGFLVGFVAAVPIIVTDLKNGFSTYLRSTWNNRGHGSDSTDIGFGNWAQYMENVPFFGTGWVTWAVIAVIVATPIGLLIADVYNRLTKNASTTWVARGRDIVASTFAPPAAFTAAGFLSNLAIMISVPRLWGFYLFIGSVLLLIGFWSAIDRARINPLGPLKTIETPLTTAVCVAFAFLVITPGLSYTAKGFYDAAARSDKPSYAAKETKYDLMVSLAEEVAATQDEQVWAPFAAHFWHPMSNGRIRYSPIYGPFDGWAQRPHLVFLDASFVTNYKPRGTNYDQRVAQARKSLHSHTDFHEECSMEPCYRLLNSKMGGFDVFLRGDLEGELSASNLEAPGEKSAQSE